MTSLVGVHDESPWLGPLQPLRAARVEHNESCAHHSVDGELVERAQTRRVPGEVTDRFARWCGTLADESRARIVFLLRNEGELCPCTIAATLDMPASTVAREVTRLVTASIVQVRQSDSTLLFSLQDHYVETVLDVAWAHFRSSS